MELVNTGQVAGPWWAGRFRREQGDYAEAEANATAFRSLFFGGDELGPVLSLPKVAASAMGILVFVIRNSKIDGASAFIEGLPFVFVSERFAPRCCSHLYEIGHLVAHHDPSSSFAVVDSEVSISAQRETTKLSFTRTLLLRACSCLPGESPSLYIRFAVCSKRSEMKLAILIFCSWHRYTG